MRKEWQWLITFGLISILIIGLMTNFKFTDVEVQMHDIYLVINPIKSFIFLTFILWTIRNFYLLVDLMTDKYKIIAVFVAIINPLIGLFIIVLIYFNIKLVTTFKQMYPDNNFTAQIIPICILVGLIAVQTTIEIRTLKKLKGLIR